MTNFAHATGSSCPPRNGGDAPAVTKGRPVAPLCRVRIKLRASHNPERRAHGRAVAPPTARPTLFEIDTRQQRRSA